MATKADLIHVSSSSSFGYIDGVYGKALESNSGSTTSFTADNYDLVLGSDFTISFYLDNRVFLDLVSEEPGKRLSVRISVDIQNNQNKTSFDFNSSTYSGSFPYSQNSVSNEKTYMPTVGVGDFHHAVIQRSYDGVEATTAYYLDFKEVYRNTSVQKLMTGRTDVASHLFLGVAGKIDHLKTFHKTLSPDDLKKIS